MATAATPPTALRCMACASANRADKGMVAMQPARRAWADARSQLLVALPPLLRLARGARPELAGAALRLCPASLT
eukprot:15176259-Alexandrium_andersonii.AAC.1